MIFIVVKFTVRPEYLDTWTDLVGDFTQATREEPGNLWFEWSRSVDHPDQFVLLEAFRDGDAGGEHVNSAHFKAATEQLPPLLLKTPEIINVVVPGTEWSALAEITVENPDVASSAPRPGDMNTADTEGLLRELAPRRSSPPPAPGPPKVNPTTPSHGSSLSHPAAWSSSSAPTTPGGAGRTWPGRGQSPIPHRPRAAEMRAERLRSVLHVLYLLFNEGYATSSDPDVARSDRSGEAIRLTRAVHAGLPEDPEVAGLLALMLLTDARRRARSGTDGQLIPLAEQDRTPWDRRLISEGVALITAALKQGRVGEYQIQAAIAMSEGPSAGLAPLDGLGDRLGDRGAAITEFRAAATRTNNLLEQQYLTTEAAHLATEVAGD